MSTFRKYELVFIADNDKMKMIWILGSIKYSKYCQAPGPVLGLSQYSYSDSLRIGSGLPLSSNRLQPHRSQDSTQLKSK